MRIGFIGTGGITQAVVTGLCRSNADFECIRLSPRNADVAAALAQLDARIGVCKDNQDVLDTSDIICIAVVPSAAAEVLRDLTFRGHHKVISFVAGLTVNEVRSLIGSDATVARAIPLPAAAQCNGSTVVYPPDQTAARMFAAVGVVVEVTDERQFDAFSAVTATMSTYYAFVEAQAQWLTGKGIPYGKARDFLAGYFVGLAHLADGNDSAFAALAKACTTEGGINELMHRHMESAAVFGQVGSALDQVWNRLMPA